jgi:hypothetical protein
MNSIELDKFFSLFFLFQTDIYKNENQPKTEAIG